MEDILLMDGGSTPPFPTVNSPKARAWFDNLFKNGARLDHDLGADDELSHVDEQLVERGNDYFRRNFSLVIISMLIGLHSLLFIPRSNRILEITGKSGSKLLSLQRYHRTVLHISAWFQGVNSLKASLRKVLQQHRTASFIGKKAAAAAQLDQATYSSLGITQLDLILTQWGFMGPALLFRKQLAIQQRAGDCEDGFVYIFYLVGKALGALDHFNLCLGTLEDVEERCQLLQTEVIQPVLKRKDKLGVQLSSHLLNGCNLLCPFFVQDWFRLVSIRLVMGEDRSGDPWFIKYSIILFQTVMLLPPGRWLLMGIFNNMLLFNIHFAQEWTAFNIKIAQTERPQTAMDRLIQLLKIPAFIAMLVGQHLFGKIRIHRLSLGFSLVFLLGYFYAFTFSLH